MYVTGLDQRQAEALKQLQYRVKKGVKPFGGKLLYLFRVDGDTVTLYAPRMFHGAQRDLRVYRANEVEAV
jgi:hypothetical protein